MSAGPGGDMSSSGRALDLFADHVRGTEGRSEPERAAAFARLCRDHPELATQLAELDATWARAAQIHDRVSGGASFIGRLNRRYGRDVDPGVSLDPESEPEDGAAPQSPAQSMGAQLTQRDDRAARPAKPADAEESGLVSRLRSRPGGGGRYRLQDELGRGGMGIVVRIWDEDLRRHLAMKVIREGPAPNESPHTVTAETLVRFLEEAQITSQLRHPGIVPVHELGLDPDGRTYFTMQLVQGNTFREVIDWAARGENRWTSTRALHVLVDICDALAYAHSKGVVHRDMKPANVMVGRFGETYVMDWGLARVLGKKDRHDVRVAADAPQLSSIRTDRRDHAATGEDSPLITMDGAVVGTPAYMPPEQANGQLELIDRRADVYSVGAMLYHLLTGQPPYLAPGDRTSPRTLLAMVKLGPPKRVHELAPAVPAELEAICEKAMARDPGRRYADMREFAEDLRAYLENRVVKAYARGALVELRKWVARNRIAAAACAATLVVAVAGAALVAFEKARSNRELGAKNTQLASTNLDLDRTANQLRQANVDLDHAAATARDEKLVAERHFAEVQRLSDLKRLHDLQEQATLLWPAWPEQAPAMRAWIGRARELSGNLELHRRSLDELRGGGQPSPTDPGKWLFADGERQWWHDTLAGLVHELDHFTGAVPAGAAESQVGTIAEMERRLERAETIESASLDEHVDEWNAAIAEIAASPKYGGLRIHEQLGLVPLGADPRSGLFEFWLVENGSRPERDARTRELKVTGETGLVFVLLPGGSFVMGVDPPSAERPFGSANVDPDATFDERPSHSVTLAPFFLSKHEMTQGQWLLQVGANPSWFRLAGGGRIDLPPTCPVENVDWHECVGTLAQLGLVLPTEAQWEYAARGGTSAVWWTGNDLQSLRSGANLADRALRNADGPGFFGEEWDDGHAYVAPVGSLRANPFGLHDTLGNVWEWCADEYMEDAYTRPVRVGDGFVAPSSSNRSSLHVLRGGSWNHTSPLARCGLRYDAAPDFRSNDLGVRPARPLRD